MTHEIIYTSAVRGLKLGSKGFCTVASSRNMSKPLAERLESLSGYRHLFAPGDARNPVTYSHVILTIASKRYHVLSRIADAGYDYSKRSNKIAHHIALTQQETVTAGPVCLLRQQDFMETVWSGEPHFFEVDRVISEERCEPRVCETWQHITGDAGWGGVLAETVWSKAQTEVYVIYKEGMDILGLMLESQALLPEQSRWMATFTTNFTKLPPHVECRWRCVLETSEEVSKIRRMQHVTVFDLSHPLGTPPTGAAVDAARSGQVIGEQKEVASASSFDCGLDLNSVQYANTKQPQNASAAPPRRDPEASLAPPEIPPPRTNVAPNVRLGEEALGQHRQFFRTVFVAVVALLLLLAAGGVGYFLAMRGGPVISYAELSTHEDDTQDSTTHAPEGQIDTLASSTALSAKKDNASAIGGDTSNEPKAEEDARHETGDHSGTGQHSSSPSGDQHSTKEAEHQLKSTGEKQPPSQEDSATSTSAAGVNSDTAEASEADSSQSRDEEVQLRDLPQLPTQIDIYRRRSITDLGNISSFPIGSLGDCVDISLELCHPAFTSSPSHNNDHRKWEITAASGKLVGTFLVKDHNQFVFEAEVGADREIRQLARGAVKMSCGKWNHNMLLRKGEATFISMSLPKLDSTTITNMPKIDCSSFPQTSLRVLSYQCEVPGLPITAGKVSEPFEPPSLPLDVSLPHDAGPPLALTLRMVFATLSEGTCCVRPKVYLGGEEFSSDHRVRLFDMRNKLNTNILQTKERIAEATSNLRDIRPEVAQHARQIIPELHKQIGIINENLKPLYPFFRLYDAVEKNDAGIKITLTLCYLQDGIQIPVIESDIIKDK